ncbi:MAG: FAD:protein FMN transferase [Rhodospirillaceae bacterium]
MGTTLEISVYRPEAEAALGLEDLAVAHATIVEIDERLSLYKSNSELVEVNAKAGKGLQPISSQFSDVLSASTHFGDLSGGALDVAIQPLIALWGFYDVSTAEVPPNNEVSKVMSRVGIDHVQIAKDGTQVAMASGAGMDFGGIAKGVAVDRAIEVLKARGVPAGLINLGGNIRVFGALAEGRAWRIGIRHPRESRIIGQVSLTSGAVATSGDYDRYFIHDGKRYSHILDPRTGWPVENIYSLTVVAPDATTADALSTAAFVLGEKQGMQLLTRCSDVEGVLLRPSATSDNLDAIATTINTQSAAIEIDTAFVEILPPNTEGAEKNSVIDCGWRSLN